MYRISFEHAALSPEAFGGYQNIEVEKPAKMLTGLSAYKVS